MTGTNSFTLILIAVAASFRLCSGLDFRYVQGTDLQESVEKFEQPGVERFSELLFDIPRYQLIVGSRDYLFRLSLEGLRKLEEAHWPAPANTINTCRQKGQSELDCRNFVKILLSSNNKIFTCGTNAFSPECTWRDVNSLNTITEWVSGIARCPYSPHYNSTALMTVNGDYYIASALDFAAQDHTIYRITGKKANLRTVQYDPKWLSGPDFVSSYEIGNFTYFFFREAAVEYINCGKVVYSRIGRVCKNDQGGKYMLKDKWTTFLKARLNCSVPGAYPFYYNELQGVHYLEQEQMVYATFTTPQNSIYGAAICAFNMSAVARAFDGPFKHQSNPKSSWEKTTVNHKHFQCESSNTADTELDAERYQLMDEPVQSAYQQPVYTTQLERLSHIVVDVVPTKHHDGVHVIFVATVEGILRKMAVIPRIWKTCLVEEIRLFPENSTTKIYSLKLSKDVNSLYLGTDNEVIRVSVQRCKRFKTRAACLNAMDPYCGWNEHQLSCTTAPHRNPKSSSWKQDLLACPRLDLPSDGGWSPWTKWIECTQTGIDVTGDRCLCHSRKCTNPTPSNGGKQCSGISNEVSNCTRNGQWTEWSSWSACSATCGMAVKTRRRICGNPAPAFGGRVCIGPERDEIYCTSNPPCPANNIEPVDGQWSEWGAWDECSTQCGGGMQSHRRKCSNPAPAHGGRECAGCNVEYRPCNSHKCPEVRKSTPWTPWLKANNTKDGHFEQRYRFSCRVNIPDQTMVRVGPSKKEERFCLEGTQSCLDAAFVNIDGEWSEWTPWNKCTVPCGVGTQTRERICDNPRPSGNGADCQGEAKQEQECNLHSCEGYWTCWTEFSPCSVSCGRGNRVRNRKCKAENHLMATHGCVGDEREETECHMALCHPIDGWREWSVWSMCDNNREQHRQRSCNYTIPTATHCRGSTKESRLCVEGQLTASESKSSSDDGVHLAHAISSGFCGLIIGSLTTGMVMYFCFRKKGRPPFEGLSSKRQSNPNHYNVGTEWKKNNIEDDSLKVPLREAATIKRTPLRTKIENDHLFQV